MVALIWKNRQLKAVMKIVNKIFELSKFFPSENKLLQWPKNFMILDSSGSNLYVRGKSNDTKGNNSRA